MTDEQIAELVSSIYRDLYGAVGSWEVWKEVRNQLSQRQAGHLEFFHSIHIALLDSVILAISRVLDKTQRTMSIPNLVKARSGLFGCELRQRLDDLSSRSEPTFHKIKQRRDQHIAHQDRKKDDPDNPLDVAEIDEFVDSLVGGFRELGGILQSKDYDFEHTRESRKRETTRVMVDLQKDWENPRPSQRTPQQLGR